MRVALFGGSFDPPHRGHVSVAQAAADHCELDVVLFTPTGLQPMKRQGSAAGYADRVAMVSLLTHLDPRFRSSRLDAPRPDHQPNYTVETLEQLRNVFPEPAQLFAIVGADSFLELPRWHHAKRLFSLAEWIVVSRPGVSITTPDGTALLREPGLRVHLIQSVAEDISATDLRHRLSRHEDCSGLLCPAVEAYIRQHGLYQ